MAKQQNRSVLSLIGFLVLVVLVSTFDGTGPFAFVAILLLFFWLVRRGAAASKATSERVPTGVPPDVAARMSHLAGELVLPGGRSNDEVVRDVTELYAELPPDVRRRLEAAAPQETGWKVEVSGPLAERVSQWTGVPVAPGDGIVAPDVLTGGEATPPGSVPEGWYRTADGSRERWHNGAGWTAHERVPGSEG